MRGRWLVVAAFAFGVPSAASAEDDIEMDGAEAAETAPVKDPKVAQQAIASARQLVRKGDAAARAKKTDDAKARYAEAAAAYERAIEAGADVGTYVDLAAVEEKLGALDRAALHYRTVLETQGVRADLVKKATARYDELTTKIGLVTLAVKPDGTTITINGKIVGTTPLAAPLVLMPGAYTISLAADGHVSRETEIKVDEGSESERSFELEPEPQEPTQPKPPEAPVVVAAKPSAPSKTPMLVAGGAAVALVAVAGVTGVLAIGKQNQFEDASSSPQEREDARDAGKRFALVTDLCLAGAVVGGGIAAYWYFAKYRATASREQVGAKADVVPWVKADAGGFAVLGAF